jgi:hypothetical protein
MKDLVTKIGRFCENHIEKIVLVIVGAVCVWLFFTRVIFSPNGMVLDRTNKAYAPGQIDRHIYDQKAQELRAKLQQKKSGVAKTYARRLDGPIDAKDPVIAGVIGRPLPKGFAGLFDSPLGFLSGTSTTKPPSVRLDRQYAGRKYRLPLIPDVMDVGANHIRAAAYVPLQAITAQMTYDKAAVEPNDIDLVTVEAKFDVAELYRRFQASFAGVDVQKEEWRDPCLAKPIFAAVQLERQELLEDGAWSTWKPMPRSRVEANRDLFQVIDRVENLPPGGLDVRLMQFNREEVAMGLLQPESYQIASAEEEWFPPSYYTKFKDLQRKVESEKKRDEKEKDHKQNTPTDVRREAMNRGGQTGGMYGPTQGTGRGAPGSGRIRNTPGGMPGGDPMYNMQQRGGRGARAGGMPGPGGEPMMGGRGRSTTKQGQGPSDQLYGTYGMPGDMGMRRRSTTNEAYWDFSAEMITYREDLAKRSKPLLFWVFDDTAEPGKTYQYRLRLGVFNPVAGTTQLVDRDLDKKDQVILWSPYSEVTKPIEIQKMIYLFAKDAQDKTNTATVEVARFALGYWRTEDFQVKPGEAIGKVTEPKKEDDKDKRNKDRARLAAGYPPAGGPDRITGMRGGPPMGPGGMPGYMPAPSPEQQNVPKKVNYSTGKVLVDLVPINDWGNAPNLRPRMYHDMLYTGDGTRIEHMPVSPTNWPKDLAAAYQYIQTEKHKEPQPFRAFNKSGMRGRTRGTGRPGPDEAGAYDDMGYEGGDGLYNYQQ